MTDVADRRLVIGRRKGENVKMDIDGVVEDTSRKVQVRFVTKLKPPFKAPTTSIALPSNLTRMGLSAVVNNLLESGEFVLLIRCNEIIFLAI
ncbi:hypothetical protein R6Q59_000576 [Mikania micrantha]